MNKSVIILIILLTITVLQAPAQEKTNTGKVDSIVAVLPRLSGGEKLDALLTLIDLTYELPIHKAYTYLYLDEARRQKNVEAESTALLKLTLVYYPHFNSDSIFIVGEEAIRFARQHNRYDDMFFAQSEIIRRYKAQGQFLIALRRAEEAYAEAKTLQENRFMARTLSSIGEILYNMEQYETAVQHWLECIALATPDGQAPDALFILDHYDLLCLTYAAMERPQEVLRYAGNMRQELDRVKRDKPDLNLQHYLFYMEFHYAMAHAEMKQPEQTLEAIRRAEAIYDPQWNEYNPSFAFLIDCLYAVYHRAAGNYDQSLALFDRIVRFDEEAGRVAAVIAWKQHMAKVNYEKRDYRAAADLYGEVLQKRNEINREQYFTQLGELRTIYELDKSEMESGRRLAALLQQRYVIAGLAAACFLLALIVGLTVWSRRRIAEKNRGLYLQIKAQDHLSGEVERLKRLYESGDAAIETLHATSKQQKHESVNCQQNRLVTQFHQYMLKNNNYLKPEIDLDEIALALATSRSYFFDAVKTVMHKTPTEYINDMRLEKAKQMLEVHFDRKVNVIAGECGFNSRSVFYRLFRERYHISPTSYRNLAKKKG